MSSVRVTSCEEDSTVQTEMSRAQAAKTSTTQAGSPVQLLLLGLANASTDAGRACSVMRGL